MAAPPDPTRPKPRIEHDGYLVMYAPDSGLDGLEALHFIAKRTYALRPDEMIVPIAQQRPLFTSDVYFEDADPFESSLRFESDLGPPKPGTDLIVNANCYAPGGNAIQCRPSVQVGQTRIERLVVGNRVAFQRAGGRVQFTPAEPFSVLPLRYELAYGGVDRQQSLAPLVCASNPLGTGYWVAPVDGEPARDRWTVLPNIEFPDRVMTPDTLVVQNEKRQVWQAPAGFGPVPKHWEPRASRAGMPEGARGLWGLLHGKLDPKAEQFPVMRPEFWSCASPGLCLPHLDGHEKITLRHMHRDRDDLVLRLPIEKPKLRVAINDAAMAPVTLTLDTVHIEVEAEEVMLSWRGTVKPGITNLDDLKRVLIEVDGQLTLPAPLIGTGFPADLLTGEFPGPDVLNLKGIPRPGQG
ncbi:MAG: DUF2169 domain-containing protein [Myxococcales bacterium]|nr:DUF2169 domain-containing protein [Myxococcales bacterium]